MRDYLDADLNMLEHLIDWNDQRGRNIHIEVKKVHHSWVVSFIGSADEGTQSLIAQFTGESEDVLDRWAKSIIRRYERRKKH